MGKECLLFLSIILKRELHLHLLLHCDSAYSDCGVEVLVWVFIFPIVTSLMSVEREVFLNTHSVLAEKLPTLILCFLENLLCFVVLGDHRHVECSVFIKQVHITVYL